MSINANSKRNALNENESVFGEKVKRGSACNSPISIILLLLLFISIAIILIVCVFFKKQSKEESDLQEVYRGRNLSLSDPRHLKRG